MTSGIAVVTGASGGIGAEIARALGADGFRVLAQYRTNEARALDLQRTIRETGGDCDVVQADLSTPHGVVLVVDAARRCAATWGSSLDVLVNNAARLLGPSFADSTIEQFDEFVNLNTRAPFFLAQGLSQQMVAGASIVNISSASAHIASAGDIVYAMTKSALESLTRNIAEALAPRGIRVNAVIPGFTDNGHPAFADERAVAYMGSLSMLGGVANPSAVSNAVRFLVSEKANRTTGTTLDVTGGMTLHPRPLRQSSVRDLL